MDGYTWWETPARLDEAQANEYVDCMSEYAQVETKRGRGSERREREREREAKTASDWLSTTSCGLRLPKNPQKALDKLDCRHGTWKQHRHPQIFLTDLGLGGGMLSLQ